MAQTSAQPTEVSGLIIYTDDTNAYSHDGVYYSLSEAQADGINVLNANCWAVVAHYHVSEFFRLNPAGSLWVKICEYNAAYPEIEQMQTASGNTIRQFGIHNPIEFSTTEIDLVQAQLTVLREQFRPAVALLSFGKLLPTGVTLSTLPDLMTGTTPNAPSVSVVAWTYRDAPPNILTQPICARYLYGTLLPAASVVNPELPNVGATLGALSRRAIHEHHGWVQVGNLDVGSLEREPTISDTTPNPSQALLFAIHAKGYTFARRFPDFGGSYLCDDFTCTASESDYNNLRNNRVINEAVRGVYKALLPYVNSPIVLQPDGKLSPGTKATFESTASTPLANMQAQGNISAYQVIVPATQNVLTTNKIQVQVRIIPVGGAKYIEVSLGFVAQI